MNYRLVLKLTGKTLLVEAGAMLLPLLVTLLYREDLRPFLFTLPILLLVAIPLSLLPSSDHFFPRCFWRPALLSVRHPQPSGPVPDLYRLFF